MTMGNHIKITAVLALIPFLSSATAKPLEHRDVMNLFARQDSVDGCLADDQCSCGVNDVLCSLDMSWALDPAVVSLMGYNSTSTAMTTIPTTTTTVLGPTSSLSTAPDPSTITTDIASTTSTSTPSPSPPPQTTTEAPPPLPPPTTTDTPPPQPSCPVSNDEHWPSCEECPNWEPSPDRCVASEFSAACSCPDPCGHVLCIF